MCSERRGTQATKFSLDLTVGQRVPTVPLRVICLHCQLPPIGCPDLDPRARLRGIAPGELRILRHCQLFYQRSQRRVVNASRRKGCRCHLTVLPCGRQQVGNTMVGGLPRFRVPLLRLRRRSPHRFFIGRDVYRIDISDWNLLP